MRGRRWLRAAAGVASVAAAVALLAWALPAITEVSWASIAIQLGAVRTPTVLGLAALWFGGLWVYTFVLTGSLPGLRHPQALVLNCAGSAVSNLLPFGGAAGVAVMFAMARSWGHPRRAIALSAAISGIWNVCSRLALPVLGLGVLAATGEIPDPRIIVAATIACVLLLLLVALGVAAVTADRHRGDASTGPSTDRPWLRRIGVLLLAGRRDAVAVIRHGWFPLTVGMVGYLGMQYLLFRACLMATSTPVDVSATIASFALSRILAITAVTPGGVGVTESGTAALLIALGAPGAPVAAALVLFGFFTHLIEIPVGGLAMLAWAAAKRWRVKEPAPVPDSEAE